MRYKLVCFDLDGTVIDETIFIWQTLHEALGTDKELRKKALDSFFSGKITYADWAQHDFQMWKDAGGDKATILKAIKPLRLMNGAKDVIKSLKKQGVKLAIISGSIDVALSHVLPDYRSYFDDVFINKLVFDSSGELVEMIPTPYDFEHKASALKEICEREGILPSECVFVGDHDNDVFIAELAGLSIAFNCKSDRLAQVADVVVKEKDLRQILEFIH